MAQPESIITVSQPAMVVIFPLFYESLEIFNFPCIVLMMQQFTKKILPPLGLFSYYNL
jgi:hypothetical protein